ncbi:hypothetical protein ACFLZX_06425 [Nanoarchaeota archaeon]
MVDQRLIDYIINAKKSGQNAQQLFSELTQRGYRPKDVLEAINIADQQSGGFQSLLNNKPLLIKVAGIGIGLLIAIIIIYFIVTRPVCGDGVVDEGENEETCCLDSGCLGQQNCTDNTCIDPTCGDCEYLDNHICKRYTCCKDSDCNDSNTRTIDTCLDPSSNIARCLNELIIELSNTPKSFNITTNRSATFTIDNVDYIMTLDTINPSSASFSIATTTVTLRLGESKNTDIDSDDIADISLELNSTSGNIAQITIKKLSYACFNDSDCDDYNETTTDKCLYPGSVSSICANEVINQCVNNSDCNDSNATTKDTCYGTPKTCHYTLITVCAHNDSFCPPKCRSSQDNDCGTYDCEDDFECFIDGAEECDLSKVLYNTSITTKIKKNLPKNPKKN